MIGPPVERKKEELTETAANNQKLLWTAGTMLKKMITVPARDVPTKTRLYSPNLSVTIDQKS